jgi:hypothetical protein
VLCISESGSNQRYLDSCACEQHMLSKDDAQFLRLTLEKICRFERDLFSHLDICGCHAQQHYPFDEASF